MVSSPENVRSIQNKYKKSKFADANREDFGKDITNQSENSSPLKSANKALFTGDSQSSITNEDEDHYDQAVFKNYYYKEESASDSREGTPL